MKKWMRWTVVVVAALSAGIIAVLIFFPTVRWTLLFLIAALTFSPTAPPPIAAALFPANGGKIKIDRAATEKNLNAVLTEQFPVGTHEAEMKQVLISQGFKPLPPPPKNCVPKGQSAPIGVVYTPCYDTTNVLKYDWNRGFVCAESITVRWQINDRSEITQVEGSYSIVCF